MGIRALTEVLADRADKTPDAVAYEAATVDGEVRALSYRRLAGRVSALAARLAEHAPGPVLLASPAGLDYPVAVFAAFLAGRPVIPAYPPGPMVDADRLAGIVADARPSAVIGPPSVADLGVPATVTVPGDEADDTPWQQPDGAAQQETAIIQYTSGSTGTPRGVLVRHEAVVANTAAIARRFGLTPESRGLTWLPPFHDMGLIGGLLTPVAAGIPTRILDPGDFLKAPLWWLRQITETGATATGGPDFAYALCVRRARNDAALDGLDLSGWQVAFSGGEPVRRRTLETFARTFAPAGFRAEAFLPCYGLAEATLMVTAGHWSGPAADSGADSTSPAGPVSCGTPIPEQKLAVVDPETSQRVTDGAEGEIWIAGPNVTPGYLNGDDQGPFGELDGVRYLRTGDLGRLRAGELYVTGRSKDVIVYRGVNYHAADIEAAALEAVGQAGRAAAAFMVEGDDPLTVLVLETPGGPDEERAATIRAAVLERTRLRLDVVTLVPPRSVPRTSSGKVRRSATRDVFLVGTYDDGIAGDRSRLAIVEVHRARTAAADGLTALVRGIVAEICEVPECGPDESLLALGLDSVRAAEAAAVLQSATGLGVPLEAMFAATTPGGVADAVLEHWLAEGATPQTVQLRLDAAYDVAGAM